MRELQKKRRLRSNEDKAATQAPPPCSSHISNPPTTTASFARPPCVRNPLAHLFSHPVALALLSCLVISLFFFLNNAATVVTSSSAERQPTGRPHTITMARVFADVNANMPRSYWDYDSVNIQWGVLENYEVVRKIGRFYRSSPPVPRAHLTLT